MHEAIIDIDTWNTAQKYLSCNLPRPVPTNKQVKNPLSGLIICGVCGRRMIRRSYSNRSQADTLMCPVTACNNISSKLSFVEDRLIQSLRDWLNQYRLDWVINKQNSPKDIQVNMKKKTVKKIEDEIKTLEKQMHKLHDLLEQAVYDTNTFLERSRLITEKINQLEKDQEIILAEIEENTIREKSQNLVIPKIERILNLYYTTDNPALKNELLKEVLEKVKYTKKTDGRCRNNPDNFDLEIYPKLPF